MAEIPSVEQVGTATTYFTSQAGISNTILAFVCLGLAAAFVWIMLEHKKERAEQAIARSESRDELFGNKERGIEGIIPSLVTRTETMRKEVWDSVDKLVAVTNDVWKAIEERRRNDSIEHFAKLDDVLNEVKDMSQADLMHHSRVETKVAELIGALREQSTRIGDLITLMNNMLLPWDGSGERRKKRARG